MVLSVLQAPRTFDEYKLKSRNIRLKFHWTRIIWVVVCWFFADPSTRDSRWFEESFQSTQKENVRRFGLFYVQSFGDGDLVWFSSTTQRVVHPTFASHIRYVVLSELSTLSHHNPSKGIYHLPSTYSFKDGAQLLPKRSSELQRP